MTLNDLRDAPVNTAPTTTTRVRAVKDLITNDGPNEVVQIPQGSTGTVIYRTGAGVLVKFDGIEKPEYEHRQVFDFTGQDKIYKLEDEIELI